MFQNETVPKASEFAGMAKATDLNDGKEWSEMDLFNLRAAFEACETIEEAARFLRRSNTVEDVRAKARELGLAFRHRQAKTGATYI